MKRFPLLLLFIAGAVLALPQCSSTDEDDLPPRTMTTTTEETTTVRPAAGTMTTQTIQAY